MKFCMEISSVNQSSYSFYHSVIYINFCYSHSNSGGRYCFSYFTDSYLTNNITYMHRSEKQDYHIKLCVLCTVQPHLCECSGQRMVIVSAFAVSQTLGQQVPPKCCKTKLSSFLELQNSVSSSLPSINKVLQSLQKCPHPSTLSNLLIHLYTNGH